MPPVTIHNPQLEGDPFFWEGGDVGVLLIHGYTATTAEVRPLAEMLHEWGYTVAAPLLPGHYTTPTDANHYRWQDWVCAVDETYNQLASRCSHVFIAGESAGGALALYLAGEHPEAAGVIVFAPALRLQLRPLDVALLYLMSPFVAYVPKRQMDADSLWQGYPVNPLRGAIELLRLQRQLWPRLKAITQPLFIGQGRRDTTVDLRVPDELYAAVGSAVKEVHWFDQSGHCVIIDVERESAFEMVHAFIERVLAT
jgi:carboxylesterase